MIKPEIPQVVMNKMEPVRFLPAALRNTQSNP